MLTALFVVLSIFLSRVSAQSFAGFDGDGLAIIPLAIMICSLFILLFVVQIIHCFVVWVLTTGHRWPCCPVRRRALLSTTNISILTNIYRDNTFLSTSHLIEVSAVNQFSANWGAISLYISLVAFLFDRRRAIRSAAGGKIATRENVVLIAIHFTLVLLLLIFGIASPAVKVDGQVHYRIRHDITRSALIKRLNISVMLKNAFNAFLCLSSISFLVSALSLYKYAHRSGVRDPITSILLYVVGPLYALFNLCGSFIFVIMFSESGIRFKFKDDKPYRNASIAANFLIQFFYFATAASLLLLATRRSNWDVQPVAGTNSSSHAPPLGYPSRSSSPLSVISQDLKLAVSTE